VEEDNSSWASKMIKNRVTSIRIQVDQDKLDDDDTWGDDYDSDDSDDDSDICAVNIT